MRRTALVCAFLLGFGLLPGPASAGSAPAAPAVTDAPVAAPAAAPAESPVAAQVEAPVPTIEWGPCEFGPRRAQCAVVDVPLDYDDPTGATTRLDLLRMPATRPAERIGSLFVNPGGPGGSSTGFAAFFPALVEPEVSQRFDIVGIDPRGVGQSTPMACRNPAKPPPFPSVSFPMTRSQARVRIRIDRWFRTGCRENPSAIVGHMSTADTARDMDLIRQAVGDERLTYYGVSYGTYLGATYAAMFPDRVRALIVDGVLDPISWSTGRNGTGRRLPFSYRLNSGLGAWQALTSAFAECDRVGRRRCALAGHASEKWNDIVRRLRRGPVRVAGGRLTYADVVDGTLGVLYASFLYPYLMEAIDDLHRQMFGPGARTLAARADWDPRGISRRITRRRGIPGPYGGYLRYGSPFVGVACSDSDNPVDPWTWWWAGIRADRRTPWFGRPWTWASSTCANYPLVTKQDRFTGPWFVTPSAPLLVVGNTYDPATPLHGAQAVNRMFRGSRLLVMNGWGHGAIDSGPCVSEIYRDYLIDGRLPAPGTVCRPGTGLFPA